MNNQTIFVHLRCQLGNWSEELEIKKERKEKDNTRREKLAGYFFDLSKLVFAALVLGGITPLFTNVSNEINWPTIIQIRRDLFLIGHALPYK